MVPIEFSLSIDCFAISIKKQQQQQKKNHNAMTTTTSKIEKKKKIEMHAQKDGRAKKKIKYNMYTTVIINDRLLLHGLGYIVLF